jgi:hypothetical protein
MEIFMTIGCEEKQLKNIGIRTAFDAVQDLQVSIATTSRRDIRFGGGARRYGDVAT